MRLPIVILALGCSLAAGPSPAWGLSYVASDQKPPAPAREFRGVWVATVGNINWPSKPGLSSAQQQAELITILDRAAQLKLNAIVFQVRPACDALYASKLEPWSEYLSGTMGQPPRPFYDPLAFAVQAAHQRGLELHAWFNPFRARFNRQLSLCSANHVSRTRPQLVKTYGKYLWLDPGERSVHDYSLQVILDVVKRYDIDGVHLDDYFYPYPEMDGQKALDFPDSPSWSRYVASGGKLSREDWRRDNINRFLKNAYQAVKTEKAQVKFGISPFGIWRPGYPAPIRGFDSYQRLYADSRKWLAEGWVDYFAPQLYWSIGAAGQSYPMLLKWWADQNPRQRHLWPGISLNGQDGKRSAAELVNQVRLTRQQTGATGHILWSVQPLLDSRRGLGEALGRELYNEPALVPPSPWLEAAIPVIPKVDIAFRIPGGLKLSWEPGGPTSASLWVLQVKNGGQWHTEILPGHTTSYTLARGNQPDLVAVTAVGRCGNAGRPAVWEKQMEVSAGK